MQNSDRESFGKLIVAVGELYNRELSSAVIKLYWKVLSRFDWVDVLKAFECHVEDTDAGHFMPKPADIIRAIEGSNQCKGLGAWSKVECAIRLVGPYSSVVFDDSIIHIVLAEMGGWIRICQSSEKDLPFVSKEFQTRYTGFKYRTPKSYVKQLTGLSAHRNSLLGFEAQSPTLIGNEKKAQLVLQGGGDKPLSITIKDLVSNNLPQLRKCNA